MGPGVLRCAAHAAHYFVVIRARAGECAALCCRNAALQSMHGPLEGEAGEWAAGACAAECKPLHTRSKGFALQKPEPN